jgi:hypothetical protein
MSDLDWAAEIVPGQSMLGLNLGIPQTEVMSLLESSRVTGGAHGEFLIQFKNSPLLSMQPMNRGIALFDKRMLQSEKPPHFEAFSIGFSVDGVLVHLAARWLHGDPPNYYKGLLWGEVGIGSRVVMVTKHCELEFDPGDEVFYPTEQRFAGLSIGGGERSLEKEPDQRIGYIRVYTPKK